MCKTDTPYKRSWLYEVRSPDSLKLIEQCFGFGDVHVLLNYMAMGKEDNTAKYIYQKQRFTSKMRFYKCLQYNLWG